MQLGIVGLGRMGASMARRLLKGRHQCVVLNRSANSVADLVNQGGIGASSLRELVSKC